MQINEKSMKNIWQLDKTCQGQTEGASGKQYTDHVRSSWSRFSLSRRQRNMGQNQVVLRHLIMHFLTSSGVSERASVQANGRASDAVLLSLFLNVVNHSATAWPKCLVKNSFTIKALHDVRNDCFRPFFVWDGQRKRGRSRWGKVKKNGNLLSFRITKQTRN